jgi:hypothetical protein
MKESVPIKLKGKEMEGEKLFTGIEIILELVRKYYSPLCKGG